MLDLKFLPRADFIENGISRRLFAEILRSPAAIPLIGKRVALVESAGYTPIAGDRCTLSMASSDADAIGVVLRTKHTSAPAAPTPACAAAS